MAKAVVSYQYNEGRPSTPIKLNVLVYSDDAKRKFNFPSSLSLARVGYQRYWNTTDDLLNDRSYASFFSSMRTYLDGALEINALLAYCTITRKNHCITVFNKKEIRCSSAMEAPLWFEIGLHQNSDAHIYNNNHCIERPHIFIKCIFPQQIKVME